MLFVCDFLLILLALPKPEPGYTWTAITPEMKNTKAFKTLRTEWKTSRNFYKKLEERKKKAAVKK